jgi:hypothetical protein
MEKFLVKEFIGEFFSKMYAQNKGKKMDITLKMDGDFIQMWNKEEGAGRTFTDITLIDERPTIDGLVKSLSE